MAKTKSNIHIEKKLKKKMKTNPCSVNMTLFNPALWIYNYTIDVMKQRNNQLNSKTIKRLMTSYANSKKPHIPISYIYRKDVYRVIACIEQFRSFTNVERLIRDSSPKMCKGQREKRLNKYIKYIYKRLNENECRQTDLFNQIKINCEGLLYEMMLLNLDTIDLMPVNTEVEINNNNTLEAVEENNANYEKIVNNCHTLHEFVESSNIKQLAKIRLRKCGLDKHKGPNRKALIQKIIDNTWKQLKEIVSKNRQSDNSDEIVNQFNSKSVLHNFAIDRMREDNYEENDTNMVILIQDRYRNYDKCLVPISYLKNSEILEIFPNLFHFVKFTNILKLYRDEYQSLRDNIIKRDIIPIQCITTQALRIYGKLVNDPDFDKVETSQKILVNCKFLFNQSGDTMRRNEECDIVEEIVECFKMLPPAGPGEYHKKQVDSSSKSSNGAVGPDKQKNRRRAKMLNQIQAKLNTNAVSGEEVIVESDLCSMLRYESDFSRTSASNITEVPCNLENNRSTADPQTIMVTEYNTQQMELEMSAINGEPSILRKISSEQIQSYPVGSMAMRRMSGSPIKPKLAELTQESTTRRSFPESVPNSVKPETLYEQTNLIVTFKKNLKRKSANLSSVEFVTNEAVEFITIEDSPTKSQRIAGILKSPPTNSHFADPNTLQNEHIQNSSNSAT